MLPGLSRRGVPLPHLLLVTLAASVFAGCAGQQEDGLGNAPDDQTRAIRRANDDVPEMDQHDASPPLRLMPIAVRNLDNVEHEVKRLPRNFNTTVVPGTSGSVTQRALTLLAPLAAIANFDGVGQGLVGPAGTFTVNSAPPDTNGDVGPNHYVQVVNTDLAIFNKAGTVLYGPSQINTLWSGFGGGCQTNNDGDPVVLYDPIADRWVISQFSVTGATGISSKPFRQCVAVSQTPDPGGAYYRYSFTYTQFPDYPKMGVWPDAYYITYNMFSGNTFKGAKVCAFNRTNMLSGLAATQQCFNTSTAYGGLLPADLDGARLPPAGAPNTVVGLGSAANTLAVWKFHVDWTTPANSTFTGPTTLATAAFAEACAGGTCIPQLGGGSLDSLADRLMYRLAYRNFADGHQSLVVNHSVTAGASTGVRWYELRLDGSNNATIYQQGTYAPDSNYRWMGSIAQDQAGNMALGYSVSSSALKPSLGYTGRLAGDALGQMTQAEGTLFTGGGAQGSSLTRWGDYSMMGIDPTDDCTFWFTSEYIPADGTFNWKTRIGSFKMPGCPAVATNDFSIGAAPASVSVAAGGTGTSTISTTSTAGTAETVSFTATGVPPGALADFSPTSATAGSGSTLTLSAGTAAAGSYALTVTGTAPSATHSTTVTFNIAALPDFGISVGPSTQTVNTGASVTYTVSTTSIGGSAEGIGLSVTGLPADMTYSFAPASVTAGSGSTLTLTGGATLGTFPFTVTGTGNSSHSASASVTVQPVPVPDYTVSMSPASATVLQGASATYTVTTAAINGSTQSIDLTVSGLPLNASGSFSPATVTAGGSSTLTVITTATTTAGTSTLTVTGTSGATTKTATASLTVNAVAGITTLSNGVPVTGLSGATGAQQKFVINVPAGQASLTVVLSGGTGDADMYVKFGVMPTLSTWDCRPYVSGNGETCTFTNPAVGSWYVMLDGFLAYTGVTLKATYAPPVIDTTTALANGVPVTGISGATNSQQFWKLAVPAGQAKVVFTITGGTGDADLYVRSGSKPTTTTYNCRPFLSGNTETCTINAPAAGDWFVMINGYAAYTGVTLKGTYP